MVKYDELLELRNKNAARAGTAQKRLGHPPFDLASMVGARLELLITQVLGEDEPNNQKRTKFEYAYQETYAEALDELEKQMREHKLRHPSNRPSARRPRLIVPGQ